MSPSFHQHLDLAGFSKLAGREKDHLLAYKRKDLTRILQSHVLKQRSRPQPDTSIAIKGRSDFSPSAEVSPLDRMPETAER